MKDLRSMTASDFEGAYRQLVRDAKGAGENVRCLACEQCEGCRECTFCVGSRGLARCNYCGDCRDCVDCSHCIRCRGCLACQHCVDSEHCVGSAYLVRSIGCSGCTYCFGCVGLSRNDFRILNDPYDRTTYFELTSRLVRELHILLS
jgi:hypothetical protein